MIYKIKSLIEAKKYEGALELLDFEMSKNKENQELYLMKAEVLEELKQYTEALDWYDKALELNRSISAVKAKAFSLYLYHKRYDEAIILYKECLSQNPADTHALQRIADVYQEKGDYENSIAFYEKALLFEEQAEAAMEYVLGIKETRLLQAYSKLEQNELDEAKQLLKEAKEVNLGGSNDKYRVAPEDYFGRSPFDNEYDPYEKIRGEFRLLDEKVKVGYGEIYYLERKYNEALHAYPNLNSLAHSGQSLVHKANCFLEIGDSINASTCLKRALKYDMDVQDRINFIEAAFKEDFGQYNRDAESILLRLKDQASYYIRKHTNDQSVIDGNITMIGSTVAKMHEEDTYEDLTLSLHDDSDNVISLLSAMAVGTVILTKYAIAPHVYKQWVKRNHHSAHRYLLALEDPKYLKSGDKNPLPFFLEVSNNSKQANDTVITGKVAHGYFRTGDKVLVGEKTEATIKEIKVNGISQTEAKTGQEVEIICTSLPTEDIRFILKQKGTRKYKEEINTIKNQLGLIDEIEAPSAQLLQSMSKTNRMKLLEKELQTIASQTLSESQIRQKLAEVKSNYNLDQQSAMIYESIKLGKIYSIPDFKNKKWEEKKQFVVMVFDQIKLMNLDSTSLSKVLSDVKNLSIIGKHAFFENEKKIFGSLYSLSKEDREEQEFIEKAANLYKKRGASPFGKEFSFHEDQYFDCGRFINDFIKVHNQLGDLYLFSCKEHTTFINPKEGFVVSSKALYSYGWSQPILFDDIASISLENNQITVKVKNESKPYKLYAACLSSSMKLKVGAFIKELLHPYIAVNQPVSEPIQAAPTVENKEKPSQGTPAVVTVDTIIQEFKKAGLEAENPTNLKQSEFGVSRKEGKRIIVPSLDEDNESGGRIFEFIDEESLRLAKKYYDDLGKVSPITFSHTFAKGLFLIQMNGSMDDELFEEYIQVMDRVVPISKPLQANNVQTTELAQTEQETKSSIETNNEVTFKAPAPQVNEVHQPSSESTKEQVAAAAEVPSKPSKQTGTNKKLQNKQKINRFYTSLSNKAQEWFYVSEDTDPKAKKKFSNVLSSYAKLESDEEPLLLFDNTAFGSAKDGFLVTTKHIYWHNLWSKNERILISDIQTLEVKGTNLLLNRREIGINMLGRKEREEFIQKFKPLFL